MCFASSPAPAPQAPPVPPPAPTPGSIMEDNSVADARMNERKRAVAAQGRQSTLLTGGTGVQSAAPTERKTLLGQ